MDADDDDVTPKGPSALARELSELKSTITQATKERERLPQPMFWSLFRSRIDDLRSRKDADRTVQEILDASSDS